MARLSPLSDLAGQPAQLLALVERPFLGQINLRGDGADGRFVRAVESALGVAPPLLPNTVAQGPGVALLWLGPDEWLAQTPEAPPTTLLAALRGALSGQLAAVTDVSDGHAVLVLDHPRACDLLSRGCPLDLDPSAFAVGTCAQSVFAKAAVLLVREAPQRFAITVRRSFAAYLYQALQEAAALDLA